MGTRRRGTFSLPDELQTTAKLSTKKVCISNVLFICPIYIIINTDAIMERISIFFGVSRLYYILYFHVKYFREL